MVQLIANVNPANPSFQSRFQAMSQGFLAKGFALPQAQSMSLKAIEAAVMNQAQLLTYNKIYFATSLAMLGCIGFILLFKSPKKASAPTPSPTALME